MSYKQTFIQKGLDFAEKCVESQSLLGGVLRFVVLVHSRQLNWYYGCDHNLVQ